MFNRQEVPPVFAGILSRRAVCVEFPDQAAWLGADAETLCFAIDDVISWRRPWHEVQQILWDRETDCLTVKWADVALEPWSASNPADLNLKRFGDFSRQQLSKSQLVTRFTTAPSGIKVRVAVRRRPDGSCFSEVTALGELDASDLAFVNAFEAEVRDSVGLPA